jgi:uncharacterized membrane-anchored protein
MSDLIKAARVVVHGHRLVDRYFPERNRGRGAEALDRALAAVDAAQARGDVEA